MIELNADYGRSGELTEADKQYIEWYEPPRVLLMNIRECTLRKCPQCDYRVALLIGTLTAQIDSSGPDHG